MRLEKGFLHWKADLLTEFDPFETGLDRFVKLQKTDFIGKDAVQKRASSAPSKKLVTLEIDCQIGPAHGGASLMLGKDVVGTITSGEWGHRTGKKLAYAFVDRALSEIGSEMQLDSCGRMVGARVIPICPYDPEHKLMRS